MTFKSDGEAFATGYFGSSMYRLQCPLSFEEIRYRIVYSIQEYPNDGDDILAVAISIFPQYKEELLKLAILV